MCLIYYELAYTYNNIKNNEDGKENSMYYYLLYKGRYMYSKSSS